MDTLKIAGTAKTPTIAFEAEGTLRIEGRSIPENSIEFYRPIMEWLDEYSKAMHPETTLHVKLEYFNTSSSKCILDIFKKLDSIAKADAAVSVKWYFHEEDEDMRESGEDYSEIVKIPFEMVSFDD